MVILTLITEHWSFSFATSMLRIINRERSESWSFSGMYLTSNKSALVLTHGLRIQNVIKSLRAQNPKKETDSKASAWDDCRRWRTQCCETARSHRHLTARSHARLAVRARPEKPGDNGAWEGTWGLHRKCCPGYTSSGVSERWMLSWCCESEWPPGRAWMGHPCPRPLGKSFPSFVLSPSRWWDQGVKYSNPRTVRNACPFPLRQHGL